VKSLEELLDSGNFDNLDVAQVMNLIKEKVRRQREGMDYYFKPCTDVIRLITSEKETKEINDNLHFANLNFNTRHRPLKEKLTEAARLHSQLHLSLSKINHFFYDYPMTDKSFKSRFRKIIKKVIRPLFLYQNFFNVRFTRLINDLVKLYDCEVIENIHYNAHIVRTLNSLVRKILNADEIFMEWSEDLSRALYLLVEKNKTEMFNAVEEKTKILEEYIQRSQKQFEELYKALSGNNTSLAEVHKTVNSFSERMGKEMILLQEYVNKNVSEINEILTLKIDRMEELYKALSGNNTSIAEVHKSINDFTKNTNSAIGDLSKNVAVNNTSLEEVRKTITIFNKRMDKDTAALREYLNKNIGEIQDILLQKKDQIEELYHQAQSTNGHIENIHNHLNSHTNDISKLQKMLDKVNIDVDKEIDKRVKEYRNLQLTIKSVKNRLSEFQMRREKLMSKADFEKTDRKRQENIIESYQSVPNFDFYAFEEWARGSEEFVVSQQEDYVKFFAGKSNVLDIGCGRGEFLELLKREGINSYGVDVDINMVTHCKEKGLKVSQADALSHLKALEDNSLGGIFAGQLIEHLSTSDLINLIELAYDKLTPDGLIILETVNPTNLTTFSGSFYADPTHIKPVHPVPLEFFMEKAGFRDINIHYSVPFSTEAKLKEFDIPDSVRDHTRNFFVLYNENVKKLNQVLFGYANYAMIGYK